MHYQPVAVNTPAPVRVQPQYIQYEEEESEPEPPRQQLYTTVPKATTSGGNGPVPQRLQIPGAQRITDVVYTALPKPVRPDYEYSQSTVDCFWTIMINFHIHILYNTTDKIFSFIIRFESWLNNPPFIHLFIYNLHFTILC